MILSKWSTGHLLSHYRITRRGRLMNDHRHLTNYGPINKTLYTLRCRAQPTGSTCPTAASTCSTMLTQIPANQPPLVLLRLFFQIAYVTGGH